jgi:simple sugar transport system permease protein
MKRARLFLRFLGRIEGLPVAVVLAVLYIAFIITAPDVFLKYRIYMSFLQTVAPPLILALGLTFVITAGEIDLSFPAVVAFSGFVFAWGYRTFGQTWWSGWVGLILALIAGGVVGCINGLIVARIGVPSIMATLAAQFFWNGVTVLLVGGLSWNLKGIDNNLVHKLFVGRIYGVIPDQGRGRIGVPSQALWALALAIVLWFILNRHKFGESIMFIGDNPNVARVMGISVEATKIRLFTMMGVISAFAGVILTLQVRVFFPTQGGGMLLPVMAAVFIGGTSIAGGMGSVAGTFFGAYIIGSLEAGVVASGISGFWVQLVEGVVMGTSVVLNVLMSEGHIAVISDRIRRWGVPVRARMAVLSDRIRRRSAPARARMTVVTDRVRRWIVPTRARMTDETTKTDDAESTDRAP